MRPRLLLGERVVKDIEKLRQAVKADPGSAEVRMELGLAYMGIKRYREALTEFQEAARLAPEEAKAYTHLGTALAKLRRHAEAEEALLKSKTLKPESAGVHYQLGSLYESLGKREEAAGEYAEYLRLRPAATDRDIVEGRVIRLRAPRPIGTTGPVYGRKLRG